MVKHFVIWKLKDAFTVDQNIDHARKIKRSLEGLKGQIDGLVDIKVQDELLSSSSGTVLAKKWTGWDIGSEPSTSRQLSATHDKGRQ